MRIAIIGMGYVGLVTGAVFAEQGYPVTCTNTSREKVEKLNRGISPFYEPGLDELIRELVNKDRLQASLNNVEVVKKSDLVFICVGTPSLPNGDIDLSQVKQVSCDIGKALRDRGYCVVVVKSTVLPSTTDSIVLPLLEKHSQKKAGKDFGLCVNPEFLREGNALQDAREPDRIVVGELDKRSGDRLVQVYKKFTCPQLRTQLRTAEMIKYASNALLATKISFANEIANLCEPLSVDVYDVMQGVGMDHRINPQFLRAGAGWGGSCFPKDVKALQNLARRQKYNSRIIDSILAVNETQPLRIIELAESAIHLEGKRVALLGLAFKPGTDDVRESRALPIARAMLNKGAKVIAYDPKAMGNFKKLMPNLEYANSVEEALRNADLCVIQTEWEEFKALAASKFKSLMRKPLIIDGRRTLNPREMRKAGIVYKAIGLGKYTE